MRCKPRKEGERWMMSRLWRNWNGNENSNLIDSLSVNLKGIEENKQHSSIKQLNSAWLMVCFCFPFINSLLFFPSFLASEQRASPQPQKREGRETMSGPKAERCGGAVPALILHFPSIHLSIYFHERWMKINGDEWEEIQYDFNFMKWETKEINLFVLSWIE